MANNNKQNPTTTSDDRGHGTTTTSYSLNLLPSELMNLDTQGRLYTHGIPASAPLGHVRPPRIFRPVEFHNSSAHEKIFTKVFTPTNVADILERDENAEDVAIVDNQQRNLRNILIYERQKEIRELVPVVSQRPPDDDNDGAAARSIFNQLDRLFDETDSAAVAAAQSMDVDDNTDREQMALSSAIDRQRPPYPSINRTGPVEDHDRPFAEYGHLDRVTISHECNFNLTTTPKKSLDRFRAKSYAIIAHTNVSKDAAKQYILDEFGDNKIQYICIGAEMNQVNNKQEYLLIQIIFNNKIDRRKPFLKDLVGESCNYNVTDDDLAWNEYIKKSGPVEEHKTFKSIQRLNDIEWESLPTSAAPTPAPAGVFSVPDTPLNQQQPSSSSSSSSSSVVVAATVQSKTIATKRPPVVNIQAGKKHKKDADEITRKALVLAEDSIEAAMDYIQGEMPNKFIQRRKWYLDTFRYVRLRAEEKADRVGIIDKEYIWPDSFPDCTPKLRDAVEQWIKHHFFRAKRAKCLVLIGPSGTGKTSFALSLPGRVNYFQGNWYRDKWTDYARYSVYDDIPWDQFEKMGYPLKKALLTQNGIVGTNYKYQEIATINVRQPAIVLMNPENAGSLLAQPKTQTQQDEAKYWRARATIYIMKPDEYFYKPNLYGPHSGSSIGSNEPRLGGPHEFDEMRQRYHEKQGISETRGTNDFH